jgi:hypothetical protein
MWQCELHIQEGGTVAFWRAYTPFHLVIAFSEREFINLNHQQHRAIQILLKCLSKQCNFGRLHIRKLYYWQDMDGADINKHRPGNNIILASYWMIGEVPWGTVCAMQMLLRIKFDMQWNLCWSLCDCELVCQLPVPVLCLCLLLLHTHSEYSITPRRRVIEKIIVAQLIKICLVWNLKVHYHVQKSLPLVLSWASWIQSTPSHCISLKSILMLLFHQCSGL